MAPRTPLYPESLALEIRLDLELGHVPGAAPLLPWFVTRKGLKRAPHLALLVSDLHEAGLELKVRYGDRTAMTDIEYAAYAVACHLASPRTAPCLEIVKRGLDRWPRSAVLRIEKGRWHVAEGNVAKGVELIRDGLKAGSTLPDLEQVRLECAFLKSATTYPLVDPAVERIHDVFAKAMHGVDRVASLKWRLAHRLACHVAREWAPLDLLRSFGGMLLPSDLSDCRGVGGLARHLQAVLEVAGMDGVDIAASDALSIRGKRFPLTVKALPMLQGLNSLLERAATAVRFYVLRNAPASWPVVGAVQANPESAGRLAEFLSLPK